MDQLSPGCQDNCLIHTGCVSWTPGWPFMQAAFAFLQGGVYKIGLPCRIEAVWPYEIFMFILVVQNIDTILAARITPATIICSQKQCSCRDVIRAAPLQSHAATCVGCIGLFRRLQWWMHCALVCLGDCIGEPMQVSEAKSIFRRYPDHWEQQLVSGMHVVHEAELRNVCAGIHLHWTHKCNCPGCCRSVWYSVFCPGHIYMFASLLWTIRNNESSFRQMMQTWV